MSSAKRKFTLREIRDAVPGSRSGTPMTVREVAAIAQVSAGHLSNVENGTFTASPRFLWRLTRAYPTLSYEDLWYAYEETRRRLTDAPGEGKREPIHPRTKVKPKK